MPGSFQRRLHAIVVLILMPPMVFGGGSAGNSRKATAESSDGQWVFSILPRSLQKNPLVDQTIITEMTEEGRKLSPPTPAQPAYYVSQAGGYHTEGHGPGREKPPSPELLERTMQRALALASREPCHGEPPRISGVALRAAVNLSE